MTRRVPSLALLFALLLSSLLPTAVGAADPPLPDSMAAVGDSISQAASSGGSLGADYPANAWSTGTNTSVNSHYLRLLALGARISGQNHNRAVSGAKMVNLDAQMADVVSVQPDYVTVLIGGNDLCTDTVAQMTSVADFRAQFEVAMNRVMAGTSANVYVVSIPDVYQLWNLFKGDWWARLIWSTAGICRSLLANPTSTQQADVDRRAAVRKRNIDFNAQLAEVCGSYDRCRWDGNAVFGTAFAKSDVSGDYFHPSIAGQAKLASVSWAAGYTWAASPPPNQAPSAAFTFTCAQLTCSFADASTDDAGIVSHAWEFGDGTSAASDVSPSHTYAADGTYAVTLRVTDAGGLTDSETTSVSVSSVTEPPPPELVMVESLIPASQSTGKNTWTATVTILVTGPDGRGVADASVAASWSVGAGDTCTTDVTGHCSVTSDSFNKRKVSSVVMTVTDVAHATYDYVDPSPLPSVSVLPPG